MIEYKPIIQNLKNDSTYQLDILRLDLIDVEVSGNKWFKLKKNLQRAISQNKEVIITYGGAYSNHIAATAAACKKFNLKCIGVIRGEQGEELNSTLALAKKNGMTLHFVNREMYSQKNTNEFKSYLDKTFGEHYLIPEGGNNEEGVKGCFDILQKEWNYEYVFCACGTATTYAGILANKKENQNIIGISVLKGENKLPIDAQFLLQKIFPEKKFKISSDEALQKEILEDDCVLSAYGFKGYAKLDLDLLDFKNKFESRHALPLDHIYTTKLMYGVFDLMAQKKLKPKARVLVIHSGGLQGNSAFEQRYHLKPSR